jgi:hypothetical protein
LRFNPDPYTLTARFAPALAVASPLLVFAVASASIDTRNAALGLFLSILSLIGSELARDAGKRLQPSLWAGWGGSPTLRRLRFSGGFRRDRVEERHRQLEHLLGRLLPGEAEEEGDPTRADAAYDAAVADLRDLTRDRRRFGLLFRENAAYGLRRNLLGLRRWGVLAAAIGLGASVGLAIFSSGSGRQLAIGAGVPALWAIATGAFFIWVVNERWVRVPAEEYADRLFGALRVLSQDKRDGTSHEHRGSDDRPWR